MQYIKGKFCMHVCVCLLVLYENHLNVDGSGSNLVGLPKVTPSVFHGLNVYNDFNPRYPESPLLSVYEFMF
jgi:hypothetical protein